MLDTELQKGTADSGASHPPEDPEWGQSLDEDNELLESALEGAGRLGPAPKNLNPAKEEKDWKSEGGCFAGDGLVTVRMMLGCPVTKRVDEVCPGDTIWSPGEGPKTVRAVSVSSHNQVCVINGLRLSLQHPFKCHVRLVNRHGKRRTLTTVRCCLTMRNLFHCTTSCWREEVPARLTVCG